MDASRDIQTSRVFPVDIKLFCQVRRRHRKFINSGSPSSRLCAIVARCIQTECNRSNRERYRQSIGDPYYQNEDLITDTLVFTTTHLSGDQNYQQHHGSTATIVIVPRGRFVPVCSLVYPGTDQVPGSNTARAASSVRYPPHSSPWMNLQSGSITVFNRLQRMNGSFAACSMYQALQSIAYTRVPCRIGWIKKHLLFSVFVPSCMVPQGPKHDRCTKQSNSENMHACIRLIA